MEKTEQQLFYHQAKKLSSEEQAAFLTGVDTALLINEVRNRLAYTEAVLDRVDPGLKEKLYKP